MLISIIIPVYNSFSTIEEAINSIVLSSNVEYEIVIVDNKSDCETQLVLNEIENINSRVKCIYLDKNYGAGYARNIGIENSTGDFIFFIDSDDRFSEHIKLCDLIYKLNSKSDVILMNYAYVLRNFNIFRNPESKFEVNLWNKINHIKNHFMNINDIPDALLIPAYPWNKVYKRTFIEKNNIRFSETMCHNDLKFSWQSMVLADSIAFLPETIVLHDIDDDKPRTTNNSSMNRLDLFKACDETEQVLYENGASDTILSYYQKFKWDAFNWGKFRIMKEGLWKFVYTYHKQLKMTSLKERNMFLREHAISNLERLKFLMITYTPIIYYMLLKRRIEKNEA